MDGALVITWKELLIGVILVLAVYIAELLLLMRGARAGGLQVWRRGGEMREWQALRKEVSALRERVARLEAAAAPVRSEGDAAATPYSRAFSLAKQGLGVAEVAASCGISRAEAELIVAMQRGGTDS